MPDKLAMTNGIFRKLDLPLLEELGWFLDLVPDHGGLRISFSAMLIDPGITVEAFYNEKLLGRVFLYASADPRNKLEALRSLRVTIENHRPHMDQEEPT